MARYEIISSVGIFDAGDEVELTDSFGETFARQGIAKRIQTPEPEDKRETPRPEKRRQKAVKKPQIETPEK